MNWLLSILIGILTGLAGIGCGLFLGTVNVRWYRISSFEGGSGYYVIGIGLAGGIAGLIVGIVATRIAAAGGELSFLRGLGTALGSLVGVALLVMGLCRLGADLPPTIDGQRLKLEVEIRAPKRFTKDYVRDSYSAHAYLENAAGKTKDSEELKVLAARREDDRWVIPTTLELNTRSGAKRFRAYFNKEFDAFVALPLRRNPRKSDLQWSPWIESAWNAAQPRPIADEAFFIRYRVVLDAPGAPTEAGEARETDVLAEINQVPESASMTELFPFTELSQPEPLRREAMRRVQMRSSFEYELVGYLDASGIDTVSDALRVVGQLDTFPSELHRGVSIAGRRLVEWRKALLAGEVPPGCDTLDEYDYGACSRHWFEAVKQLRAKAGGDFSAEFAALTKEISDPEQLAAMREWSGFPAVSAK